MKKEQFLGQPGTQMTTQMKRWAYYYNKAGFKVNVIDIKGK